MIIVLVTLAILLTIGIVKIISMANDARVVSERENLRVLRSGLNMYPIESISKGLPDAYPSTLDNAPAGTDASVGNPFFTEILSPPAITDSSWHKIDAITYQGPSGKRYGYNNSSGYFLELP